MKNAAHHPENPKMNYIEMGKSIYRKVPKILDPENFAVIYLKFKQKRPNLRVLRQNDANGIANSEDPDQTAPLGAV